MCVPLWVSVHHDVWAVTLRGQKVMLNPLGLKY